MGFADAVRAALSKYATFDGRAGRPEFWWFSLFYFLVQLVAGILEAVLLPNTAIGAMIAFASIVLLILPTVAVTARRLHDTDLSGWWQLISLVPVLGFIVLIVLCARHGTPGPNRFGAPPTSPPRSDVLVG